MPRKDFKLECPHQPVGDQPAAIAGLLAGLEGGLRAQTLLGVTGSGKTFTVANVIARTKRPALVLAPNKTLAAQLFNEFRKFFPDNAVEYFVSFYDYYQPEAYIPRSDTFIEKDMAINERVDRMRHSATHSLLDRQDVVIVASVSCIFGLGSPEAYAGMLVYAERGAEYPLRQMLRKLVEIAYRRNDYDVKPGTYRVRGDTLDIFPMYEDGKLVRISFFGDDVDSITEIDPLTGEIFDELEKITIYPASHYVTPAAKLKAAADAIRVELAARLEFFKTQGKLLEAQRIEQRTNFDLEMIEQTGSCPGIENYSRHLDGRAAGSRPPTLMDYLPRNALIFIDESHITIPQIGGMFKGDRARKETLVEYGFRLPSALDNRPLTFEEFESIERQTVYVSATPGDYELTRCGATHLLAALRAAGEETAVETAHALSLDNHEGSLTPIVSRGEREPDTSASADKAVPAKPGKAKPRAKPPAKPKKLPPAALISKEENVVQQIIRPTGLIDPAIEVRPASGQVDDLIEQIRVVVERKERALVCTLTKRMAEELTGYYHGLGIRVRYLHAEIDTFERMELLRDLRRGEFDVLVGINLLREGLDLPEVSLIAVLDADREGYLRSARSLIQIVGRAARNVRGRVIFYADNVTGSMLACIGETDRRRAIQDAYNKTNGITPKTIISPIPGSMNELFDAEFSDVALETPDVDDAVSRAAGRAASRMKAGPERAGRSRREQGPLKMKLSREQIEKIMAEVIPEEFRGREIEPREMPKLLAALTREMEAAAKRLEFEKAALIRDEINELQALDLNLRA